MPGPPSPYIVSVKEIWNGRVFTYGEDAERSYTRVFRVIMNDARGSQLSILGDPRLPARFDGYVDYAGNADDLAIVQSIEIRQEDDPLVWLYTAHYNSKTKDPSQGVDDPLARPVLVSWELQKYQKSVDQDKDGDAIVNSAFDPFDPAPTIDQSRLALTITRNEAVFQGDVALKYQDVLNSDPFWGFDPLTCKVNIKGQRHFEKDVLFWQVTYIIEVRQETWVLSLLDAGYNENPSGTPKVMRDQRGAPLQNPSLLDGAGNKLAKGGDPVYLEYHVYRELPFSVLSLPQPS